MDLPRSDTVSHLAMQRTLQRALQRTLSELAAGGELLGDVSPGPAFGASVPSRFGLLGDEVSRSGVVTVFAGGGERFWAAARSIPTKQVLVRVEDATGAGRTFAIDDALNSAPALLPWLPIAREQLLQCIPQGVPQGARSEDAVGGGLFIQIGVGASRERATSQVGPPAIAATGVAVANALSMLLPRAEARIRELFRCGASAVDLAVSTALITATESPDPEQLQVILSQPASPYPAVRLPAGIELIMLRAGRERDGSALDRVAVAAAMAYRMIAERCGMIIRTGERGDPQSVDDGFFDGHLGNIDPGTFAGDFRGALPAKIMGREFLDQYGGVADAAIQIDEDLEYPVRAAADFVVSENQRACTFVDALGFEPGGEGVADRRPAMLGAQLEHSYLAWRELVPQDADVEFTITELRKRGGARGILGARTSYGAWPIQVLVDRSDGRDADRALCEVQAAYEREYQRTPEVVEPDRVAIVTGSS